MSGGRWQWRRWLAVLAVLAAAAGLIVGGLGATARSVPTFAELGPVQMPFVPDGAQLTDSWFCPGAPRADGSTAELVVVNPTGEVMQGTVTSFSNDRAAKPVVSALSVPAYGVSRFDVSAVQPKGTFVSALVEVIGGGAQVEQHTSDPNGDSYSGCSNAASNQWFFPDGSTAGGTTEQIHITNPYAGTAIVNIQLTTANGTSLPVAWQGFPVAPESVATVDVTTLARNEPVVAISVTATRGRVIAARSQRFAAAGRTGAQVSLGTAATSDQFYFPDLQLANGVRSQVSLFNPGTEGAEVMLVPVGVDVDQVPPSRLTFTLGPGEARVVNLVAGGGDVKELPAGRYGLAVTNVGAAKTEFVAELAVSIGSGRNVATSVIPGIPGALGSVRWTTTVSNPAADAFRVLNAELNDGEIKVYALTTNGYQLVPGLESVPIGGASAVSLDLSAVPDAFRGRPLLIDCTRRVYVQRAMPDGAGSAARTLSVPLNG